MADGLYAVRGGLISNDDLEDIIPLLSKKYRTIAGKLLSRRRKNPITDYKGMWKPLPKPLRKMARNELIQHLRSFRNAWEKITTRNQDMPDTRLHKARVEDLRRWLRFYFSGQAKASAGDWLST